MSSLQTLIETVAQQLLAKHWQMATAESCTGGLIASRLTALPGSSKWFERGFVTYSNLSKQEMLGIKPELVSKFGAVSEEVAAAMALGALQHSTAQIALAVTGIAGPGGGSVEKPVGTVCLGWAAKGLAVQTSKIHCAGDRQAVRLAATQQALEGILRLLNCY